MKASRNDPCPCGSGKKYKACCMQRDIARERVRAIVGEEAFDAVEEMASAAVAAERVWEADVMPIPVRLDDAEPALVLVTAAGIIVHGEALQFGPATAEERATAIAHAVATAARVANQQPERLHVRDAALAAVLAPRLQRHGVDVQAAAMPALDEAFQAMLAQMGGPPGADRITTPESWRETGASQQDLAEFHRAAAEFYRLAPWNEPRMQIPLQLEFADGARWAASIMGDAGVATGLALYSEPEDMIALLQGGDPFGGGEMRGYSLSVDLDERGALSRAMLKEITAGGWKVAGSRAYPRLFGLNTEGKRVTAEHVRRATVALHALNALTRGRDPQDEAEVGVSLLPLPFAWDAWDDDEEEDDYDGDPDYDVDDNLNYFPIPFVARPIGPEGPGADPEAPLGAWENYEAIKAAEQERLARLEPWLPATCQNVRQADYENARLWCEHWGAMGIHAGAVTEHDLRLFIYDLYVRKSGPSKQAIKALRTSLMMIFRFLEEAEGIRYPFGEAVLDELREIERRSEEDGLPLHETLALLSNEVYDDLDLRMMLHKRDSVDGCADWPDMMSVEVARLDHELQRRWLLWYDEIVRRGTTDLFDLEEVLLERQIEWENTPHPAHDGQTPAEVIRAWVESNEHPVRDLGQVAG